VAGRLRHAPAVSRGSFHDWQAGFPWLPDRGIAAVETDTPAPPEAGTALLLFGAGRRVTHQAEVRTGFLSGWHDRARIWWGDDGAPGLPPTLLALGTCDLSALLRGVPGGDFLDLHGAIAGPAHVVLQAEHTLVPTAATLAEQIRRTPAERQAIATDMLAGLSAGPATPVAADFFFAGGLLHGLVAAPLDERPALLTRHGLGAAARPTAVLLSLVSEARDVLRHKRLGYTLAVQEFRLKRVGRAMRSWLRGTFERERRAVADIARDLAALVEALRADGPVTVVVKNLVSTTAQETLHGYASFDAPLSDTVASVRAQELNLALHDLARSHGVLILDADAVAAELGQRMHVPDGTHHSGPMQAALLEELSRLLVGAGLDGFRRRVR